MQEDSLAHQRRRVFTRILFALSGAVWFSWIIYTIYAVYLPEIPVTWSIFALFLDGILIFLVPALLMLYPSRDPLSARRFTVSIWLTLVGVYWVFAPIYSYLSVNTNRGLTLWYMIPYAWEVPAVGGLFFLVVYLRFRSLSRRVARFEASDTRIKVEELRRALTFFPAFAGVLITLAAIVGYGPLGSLQFRIFGEAPWVEVVKNIATGTTMGLITGVLFFFLLNRVLEPWLAKLPPTKDAPPFPLRRKLGAIVGTMTVLSLLIFVPVAYKQGQAVLAEGVLDAMLISGTPRAVGPRGYTFTVSRTGTVISAHPKGFTVLSQERLEPDIAHALVRGAPIRTVSRRHDSRYVVAFPQGAVSLVATAYESDFLARLRPLLWASAAVAVVFGVIFAVLIVLFIRGVAGPLAELTEAVKRMSRSRRPIPVQARTGDEIEILSGEFTAMATQLRDYEEGLERKISERTAQLAQANEELREKSTVLERVLEDVKRIDEELAALNRAKSEFISMASHQLRTPLTAVKWYARILSNHGIKKLSPTQLRAYHHIVSANEHMIELVNALLNVSRIEMGTLAIEPVRSSLTHIIAQALDEARPLALQRGVHLTHGTLPKAELVVDPKLLQVVLSNLISNAVRYTPRGGKVSVDLAAKGTYVTIAVKDTGYGIPKREQAKVFTKFFRGSNVQEKEPQGTGLGLYLTKAVVERMGGKINFTSREGKGTTFSVSLPRSGVKPHPGIKGLLPMA